MHLLSLLLILAASQAASAGLAQAHPDAAAPGAGSYIVEDPFVIEEEAETIEEEAEMGAARAAPTPRPAVAEAEPPSPDRIICRSRGELGARTRRVRVCLTAAQWQLHEVNMEQQRRDINDWGAQGAGPPR